MVHDMLALDAKEHVINLEPFYGTLYCYRDEGVVHHTKTRKGQKLFSM